MRSASAKESNLSPASILFRKDMLMRVDTLQGNTTFVLRSNRQIQFRENFKLETSSCKIVKRKVVE